MLLVKYLLEIIYFPAWWYTKGLLKVLAGVRNSLADYQNRLGFYLWVKNLFTPMFGQRDLQGRIVSFFMRLINIVGRGIALLVVAVFHLAFIVIWLVLPIFLIYKLIG